MRFFYFLAFLMACVFVSCTGSNDSEDTPVNGFEKLTLVPSSTVILAGSGEVVNFTVMTSEGQDVTAEAEIFYAKMVGNKEPDSFQELGKVSFSSDEVAAYRFFASYEAEITDRITIKSVEETLPLPDDSNPSKFEGFTRRALGVQFTGTWCPNCPWVISAIYNYKKENPDKVVFTSAHNGDPMANEASVSVHNKFAITTWPTLLVNLDAATKTTAETTPAIIAKSVDPFVGGVARTALSASVGGTDVSGSINVQAKVKVGADGEYRIAAWLLEDGIYGKQSNTSQADLTGIDIDTHNNVIRAISSSNPLEGSLLGEKKNWKKGEIADFACSFDLDEAAIAKLSNCHVAIFVTSVNENGVFAVDNVIDCPLGETVAFGYK